MSQDNMTQRGTALYLAVVIMAILLALALGISTIFLGQLEMIREMGHSVIAFYAADAGIEAILMNRNNPGNIPKTTLENEAAYEVIVVEGGAGDCPSDKNYCIKSVGSYKGVRRAIEINY